LWHTISHRQKTLTNKQASEQARKQTIFKQSNTSKQKQASSMQASKQTNKQSMEQSV